MTPTITADTGFPSPPDGRRTGAAWVAATGAFLLLAAAAVFVAVRWDDIPPEMKLAILGGLTGGFLVSGERLRLSLPATGNALFHLGALLVPVNLAAAEVRIGLGWERLLLVEGIVCAPLYAWLSHRARSRVLAAASSAAVVAAACGFAATTPVPVPAVLALAAVAAALTVSRLGAVASPLGRHAVAWAAIAGLAPVGSYAMRPILDGREMSERLGLVGDQGWLAPLAAGLLAAVVLGHAARRDDEPAVALVAGVSLAVHGLASWSSAALPLTADVLILPSLFLVIEIAALALRSDPFWSRIGRVSAGAAELAGGAAAIGAAALVVGAPVLLATWDWGRRPELGTAAGLLALGWVAADARRAGAGTRAALVSGGGTWFAAPAAVACALAAVIVASASASATAFAALSLLALWALAGRQGGSVAAAFLATYATTVVAISPIVSDRTCVAVGFAGAALAAMITFSEARSARGTPVIGAFVSVAALGEGLAFGHAWIGRSGAATLWVLGCWGLALTFDAASPRLGDSARIAGVSVVMVTFSWAPVEVLLPAAAVVAACAIEASRARDPRFAYAGVVSLVQAEAALGHLAGLGAAQIGLGLCLSGVVWSGIALLAREWERGPLLAAGAATLLFGLSASSSDPAVFGPALVIAGGVLIGAGLVTRQDALLNAGAIAATVGLWTSLSESRVTTLDALAAPVTAYLIAIGATLRARRPARGGASEDCPPGTAWTQPASASRPRPGSWVAYGPAIALLAGSALAERLGGAGAWHAVLAGAVGVAAVAVGGWLRLSAPLVLGTATLVLVTGHESLGAAAGVPTWGWLALGGVTLLAAAVAMERTDTSPIEAGRRVVDVLQERFE